MSDTMPNANGSFEALAKVTSPIKSDEKDHAGTARDVTSSAGSLSPAHSGSSNSLRSDDMCSVLCENYRLNGYNDIPNKTNKEEHTHSCMRSHMSVEDETVSHFIHLSHKKKMSSSMSRLDNTPTRLARRNTIGCSSGVCVSCESLSNLNLNSSSPKTVINNVRHTKVSLTRRQLAHVSHGKIEEEPGEYVTPLQRKERAILELRHDLHLARQTVSNLEAKLVDEQEKRDLAVDTATKDRDREVQMLREVIEDLRTTMASVTSSQQAEEQRANQLQEQVRQLQVCL